MQITVRHINKICKPHRILFTLFLIIFLTLPAKADMVWAGALVAGQIASIPVILTGLIVEILFVKFFGHVKLLTAVVVAFLMNLASTILGFILILISTFWVDVAIDSLLHTYLFDWFHWTAAYITSTIITTLTESLVLYLTTKIKFKQFIGWLLIANLISVGICLCIAVHNF